MHFSIHSLMFVPAFFLFQIVLCIVYFNNGEIIKINIRHITSLLNPINKGAIMGKNITKALKTQFIIIFRGINLETIPLIEPRPTIFNNIAMTLLKMLTKYFGTFLTNCLVFTLILSINPFCSYIIYSTSEGVYMLISL